MKYILLLFTFLTCIPSVVDAQILITEIFYDAEGADTGREWIEIFNRGDDVNVLDLKLEEGGVAHRITDDNEGVVIISSGKHAIIADDTKKFLEDNPRYSGLLLDSVFSLSNSGESVGISDNEGNMLHEVIYTSDDNEFGAGYSLQKNDNDWFGGVPDPGSSSEKVELLTGTNKSASEKNDISVNITNYTTKSEDSKTINNSKDLQQKTVVNGTKGLQQSIHAAQVDLSYAQENNLLIVGAGRDRVVHAHAPVEFEAIYPDLPNAQKIDFTWSFGDGYAKEGRRVQHVFNYPGTYNVVVNAQLDGAEAVSRARVVVKPLSLQILVENNDLFIENKGGDEVNIGLFKLVTDTKKFTFPKDTIISPGIQYISKEATGIDYEESLIQLQYPNNKVISGIGIPKSFKEMRKSINQAQEMLNMIKDN